MYIILDGFCDHSVSCGDGYKDTKAKELGKGQGRNRQKYNKDFNNEVVVIIIMFVL